MNINSDNFSFQHGGEDVTWGNVYDMISHNLQKYNDLDEFKYNLKNYDFFKNTAE